MRNREIAESTSGALIQLAAWASELEWATVPEDVRRIVALTVLDDFGAMIAARDEPELIAVRESIARGAGAAEATVFDGQRKKVDRYSAALSNGIAADWCELDGGYRPVVCHATLYCLPAALAETEAIGASLANMLLAILVGYEVVARVARCFTLPELVLHPHAGLATIGAVAAVAKLRRFSGEETAKAICTGATMVLPGPFNHAVKGALIRNAWPGLCAQNGLRAADWSVLGVTGTDHSLTEVYSDLFNAEVNPTELYEGLGQAWLVMDGYHKLYACCQYGHSVVEAILAALGGVEKFNPENVTRISVETHPKALKLDNATPATTLAAKFSIQHIAATTVTFGHAGADAFSSNTLDHPSVRRLREVVSISPFQPEMEWPNDRPARVSLLLRDGQVFQGECLSARGGRDRPFNSDEISEKAAENLRGTYPNGPSIFTRMLNLEETLLNQPWARIVDSLS